MEDTKEVKEIKTKYNLGYSTKTFFADFGAFITQGNALDLALGFILGAGFTGVIQSFVKNIVLPPIGKLLGNVDFSNLYINLNGAQYSSLAEAEASGDPLIKYGLFFNELINFLILSLVVYISLRVLFSKYLKEKLEAKKKK